MLHEKTFDEVVHISRDNIRYYPKEMVEELAWSQDKKLTELLKELDEGKQ